MRGWLWTMRFRHLLRAAICSTPCAVGKGNAAMTDVGFIGLGVMGEPMCRHLASKSGRPVVAFDRYAIGKRGGATPTASNGSCSSSAFPS